MILKYSKIISNAGKKEATMLLFGEIGNDFDGNIFAKELNYIADSGMVDKINIFINSVGGNVFEGYSIVSVIDYLQSKGVDIECRNVGVAYSMAGVILASCAKGKKKMLDYATTMIHDPFFSEKPDLTESQKQMISRISDSLATIISNGCGQDKDKIKELMSVETTMSANECLQNGIVDEIISTGKTLNFPAKASLKMVACAEIFDNENKLITNTQKQMKSVLNELGLNAEASETAAVQAVVSLKTRTEKFAELENSVKILQTENEILKAKCTTLTDITVKVEAEKLVDSAISEGRIEKESRQTMVDFAVKNIEDAKNLLKSFAVKPVSINDSLKKEPIKDTAKNTDLAKKFKTLMASNPAAFESMEQSEYDAMKAAFDAETELNTVIPIN